MQDFCRESGAVGMQIAKPNLDEYTAKSHDRCQLKKKLRAESLRPGRFGFLTEPGHPRKPVAADIEKMNIVMQTDMDPTLPRFRLGGFTHVGFRRSTRFQVRGLRCSKEPTVLGLSPVRLGMQIANVKQRQILPRVGFG